MFPLIPLLALVSIFGGGATLYWYQCLSAEEKKRADQIAGQYALEMFGKNLNELSSWEANLVHDHTKRSFG
jgi:hypothetical protein